MRKTFSAATALLTAAAMFVATTLAAVAPAAAQGRVSLIRDAEIEAILRDYATPIFGMAGFGASAPAPELYKHFGITAEAAAEAARERL